MDNEDSTEIDFLSLGEIASISNLTESHLFCCVNGGLSFVSGLLYPRKLDKMNTVRQRQIVGPLFSRGFSDPHLLPSFAYVPLHYSKGSK